MFLIGMDLGTTNIKGLLFTRDGEIVASTSRSTCRSRILAVLGPG
jgi:sugar (pentulose or hexulose) kinase